MQGVKTLGPTQRFFLFTQTDRFIFNIQAHANSAKTNCAFRAYGYGYVATLSRKHELDIRMISWVHYSTT